MRMRILTLATIISALGAGMAAQPLPGPGWALLEDIGLREELVGENWSVEKTFPPELRAAAEAPFTVTGYLVPVTSEPMFQTLMLVRDPEDCPFCGSGAGYGPVLEVVLERPVAQLDEFALVEVTGRLELIEDPLTMQTARLLDASLRVAE